LVRRLIWAAVAAAAVVAVAGTAGAALKQKSVEFTPDPVDDGIAKCKKGQRGVAGGFFGEFDDLTGGPAVIALESTRESKRKWLYRAGDLFNANGTATAYVYCDKHGPKLKTRSASETASGDPETTTITARCPRGHEAVAGGFDFPDTEMFLVGSKREGQRSWVVTILAPEGTYEAFAYCDKSEPGLNVRAKTITKDAVPDSQSVVAKCKRKQELRSGGFEVEFDFDAMTGGFAHGSRRVGKRGWEASAFPVGDSPDLTAYAYCQKKTRKR
jgi:hypothetical protein